VNRNLTREIDESLRSLFEGDRMAEDLGSLVSQSVESAEFARFVLVAGGARDLGQTALVMAAMLLTGMRVERKRHEVDLLERLYGGGAA
jgi:hypothetical protein